MARTRNCCGSPSSPPRGEVEVVKTLLELIEDLKKRLFILENPRSIEDDVQQNSKDIHRNKEDIVDIRLNEAITDLLLSSAVT